MTQRLAKLRLQIELETGEIHSVIVSNASMVAWDRTRSKRDWPTQEDAPILWQTFLAWHQLTAAGIYTGTFDEFTDRDCVAVGMTDRDGVPYATEEQLEAAIENLEEQDPTRRAPAPA